MAAHRLILTPRPRFTMLGDLWNGDMRLDDQHVRLEADDCVATLWLRRGIHTAMLDAFTQALNLVEQNPTLEILVIRSVDPGGFPATPELEVYRSLVTEGDRIAFAERGQRVLRRLSEVPLVTIAYLEGQCLGLNWEMALSCDYRIAVSTPESRLGFHLPDLPPCWGGLSRLARRFGARKARRLLNARTVSFREARRLGFVDRVCAPRRGKVELADCIDLQRVSPRKARDRFWHWPLTRKPVSPLEKVIVRATQGLEQGLAAEREAFVIVTSTPAHSHSLTLNRQAQRQLGDAFRPLPARVGIVGGSDYLADFAVEMAIRGTSVCTAPAMSPILVNHTFDRLARQGRITPLERKQSQARILTAPGETPWQGFSQAEWVLVDSPQLRLPELESHLSRHAVILLLDRPLSWELTHAERPDRLVSARSPLFPHPLFEIGVGSVAPRTVERLRDGLTRLGRTPVFVQDHPQLVSRRIWGAMADEAMRLIAEGVPIAEVDALAASLDLGKPLEFLDGLGFANAVSFVPRLRPLLLQGLHGRPEKGKQGDGFYKIAGDGRVDANVWAQMILWDRRQLPWLNGSLRTSVPQVRNMQERLLLRVVNEASAVLCEESFAGPAEIDLLASWSQILPGTGGPLSYADNKGLNEIVRWLRFLYDRNGDRFRPHSELIRRAAAGERFHDHHLSHLERIAA